MASKLRCIHSICSISRGSAGHCQLCCFHQKDSAFSSVHHLSTAADALTRGVIFLVEISGSRQSDNSCTCARMAPGILLYLLVIIAIVHNGTRDLTRSMFAARAGVPSMRRRETIAQQPMGTISGQGPPGPGAPARYGAIDPERAGPARPRGRAY